MRRPTRPPPPPPIDYPSSPTSSSSLSNGLQFSGTHKKSNSSKLSRTNYFSLSECDLGPPLSNKSLFQKSQAFKSRASTSFSSTLKSATIDSHARSNHQKSRSLTTNHFGSSYLYLDLPSSPSPFKGNLYSSNHNPHEPDTRLTGRFGGPKGTNNRSSSSTSSGFGSLVSPPLNVGKNGVGSSLTPPSIVYKTVDFLKTDALEQCKTERRKN